MPEIGRLGSLIEHIWRSETHVSAIFPEDTNETVTVTAGGSTDTFGAWAELVDDQAVTFSSKFEDDVGHIVGVHVEECDTTDKRYLLEIAYGTAKTIICRSRFMKESAITNVGQQLRVKSIEIPEDETIYYRLKCETASATAELHLRYYLE